MLANFWLLLIGIFSNLFIFGSTLSCSGGTINAILQNGNSYTLLESENFPKSISKNSQNAVCEFELSVDSSDTYIWVAMLAGSVGQIQFIDGGDINNNYIKQHYMSYYDNVTFSSKSNKLTINFNISANVIENSWTAFQAAAVTYSKSSTNHCPLSEQSFDFGTNEDLVIPVSPTFATNETAFIYRTCNWQFKIVQDQQLKIVAVKADDVAGIKLQLKKGTDLIKNFKMMDTEEAFYFSGSSSFTLTYENNMSNETLPSFFLLVSAVRPSNTFTHNGCKTSQVSGDTTSYSNIDLQAGYPSNQLCMNEITIPNNHEASLIVSKFWYEASSDKLELRYGKNDSYPISRAKIENLIINYKLTSGMSNAQLTFTSDGNTQGAGYEVELNTYECKCANSNFVVQCNQVTYFKPLENSYNYCNNMHCNYTISTNSSCSDLYFELSIINNFRPNLDYLVLRSNGIVEQNIDSNSIFVNRYYSLNNTLSLEFVSGSSSAPITDDIKSWYLSIIPHSKPNFLPQRNLNETNFKHVQWLEDMTKNDAITVCTDSGTVQIFVTYFDLTDLSNFLLYDGSDLNYFVGSLDSVALTSPTQAWLPRSRKSTSKCFTLYMVDDNTFNKGYTVLFKASVGTLQSCQNANTVFQAPFATSDSSEFDASIQATKDGDCEMIILTATGLSNALPYIWISNISTTSSSSSSSSFQFLSTLNGNKFFDLPASEVGQWQSFGVYTAALSIVVPASYQITVHLLHPVAQRINIINNTSQKGIMASPSYAGMKNIFDRIVLYTSNGIEQFTINMNVKLSGSASPNFVGQDGTSQVLTNNTSITTTGFYLYYSESNPELSNFLIEYSFGNGSNQNSNPNNNFALANNFEVFLLIFSTIMFAIFH